MSPVVNLNKAMYDVLVIGMILSGATYILGIILFVFQNQNSFQAGFEHYQTVTEFAVALLSFRSGAILTLATIFLIATPITRVVVSIFVFAFNHNAKYVVVTSIVFLILMASILLGYFAHLTIQGG